MQSNQENQIADLQNEIRIQEQDKQELYQQLFDAKKRTTKELTEVHREHLQRLEVEFEERLVTEKALLTAEKQTALDDLRKQFANQIVETTKEEVARVGREYAQQRQAQERQIAYFKTQLATSEQKNQSLVHDLEDKDRVTTSLLTQQKTAHAEELVRLEATLRGKFEETLQENIDRHLADYKKAFAELEQKFNNTVREHAAEIENLQDGFEAAKENTLKEKNDERESMVARLAQLHQSNLDEAREQFKKALADHDARTAREKDEAIREIENRCNKIVQERDAEVVEAKKALSRREVCWMIDAWVKLTQKYESHATGRLRLVKCKN